MKNNYVALDEQETVVRFYRTDEMLDIYTSDQTMITKLKKLLASSDEYKLDYEEKGENGNTLSMQVLAPKGVLKLKPKAKRELSDEQRKVSLRNMEAIHAAKKVKN